ncbi:MAG: hypothetical protein EOM03_16145 [Clostridia bacterium]|nr:hypothetical protein [Clostridia bacterium]
MNMSLEVIVSEPTPDALAYAHALERRGAQIVTPEDVRRRFFHGHGYDVPYILARPHDGSLYKILPSRLDVEALHPLNIGMMISGQEFKVPPICQAVEEWLTDEEAHDAVHVVGHGLGSIIAAYLTQSALLSVVHSRTEFFELQHPANDMPVINATRKKLLGEGVLQLPLNPPEFSRRLVDLVMERAKRIEEREEKYNVKK